MIDKENQTLKVIEEKCKDIKYGEWDIKLIIHKGEPKGFDELRPAIIRYRESQEKEKP